MVYETTSSFSVFLVVCLLKHVSLISAYEEIAEGTRRDIRNGEEVLHNIPVTKSFSDWFSLRHRQINEKHGTHGEAELTKSMNMCDSQKEVVSQTHTRVLEAYRIQPPFTKKNKFISGISFHA